MVMFVLTLILSISLVLALSGFTLHAKMDATSFSYVIAIDASSSMNARDLAPTRLEAAKKTAIDFVDFIPTGTKIGIVSFSGTSKIISPVTQDKNSLKYELKNINPRDIGGTNLLDALTTSTNLLKGELAKAVILISDGQNNVKTLEEVILYANENSVMVHTLGVGTEKGEVTGNFTSSVDRKMLQALSYNTGGEYYNISDNIGLQDSFQDVLKITEAIVPIPLKNYLLMFSIILVLVIWFLYNTRFRVIP
jgi:Ca-activated chloride channel family protein